MSRVIHQKKPRFDPHGGPKPGRLNSPASDADDEADEESVREDVLFDADMRTRLLDNSERVARSTDRVVDGYRIALQTEEVGGQILSNLGEQREKLQRSRNRVRLAVSATRKLLQQSFPLSFTPLLRIV